MKGYNVEDKHVSVCLASYNGEKYIKEQIISILDQISPYDELIISDDASTDKTMEIILSFDDQRIRVLENKTNIGYVRNFEKALKVAKERFIFLSDQDDIWAQGRLKSMLEVLENTSKKLVVGGFSYIGNDRVEMRIKRGSNKLGVINILSIIFLRRIPYFGCCMGMERSLLNVILPFPKTVESHDIWISICANMKNSLHHYDKVVLHRRLHCNNVTSDSRCFFSKIKTRIIWGKLAWIAFLGR